MEDQLLLVKVPTKLMNNLKLDKVKNFNLSMRMLKNGPNGLLIKNNKKKRIFRI